MLKHEHPFAAAAFLCLCCFSPPAVAADWELLPSRANDVELTVDGSEFDIRTTGTDPYLISRRVGTLDPNDRVLEFEYFCPQGVDFLSAYFGPPISEASRIDLPSLPIAEGWQTYSVDLRAIMDQPLPPSTTLFRVDFGMVADLRLKIRGIRLRPPTAQELQESASREFRRSQKLGRATRITNYLGESFPLQLQVRVDEQLVTISFQPQQDWILPPYQLMEYLPEHSIGDTHAGVECQPRIAIDGNRLLFAVPRHADGRDRLQSAWRIKSGDRFLSARHYASTIVPSSGDHAQSRPIPKSQKGLSGFSRRGPQQDLLDLGVHAVTVNLVLNQFVSGSPGPDKQRIDTPGPAVYFDASAFAGYDSLLDFARKHEMVVTAIVLISRSQRPSAISPLVHPEADGGVYAMPDLSTPRGVKIYSHVLDAIARRYRDTDHSPGGITNWIAHNEVDFHRVWTNMGPQPRPLYSETYYRSMRMIHNAARAHNPHARVFASLTHHWVVPDDGKWLRLAPREVIETLQRYCELEGDFGWGIAYHPYPQSLFADCAWQDEQISDDFETPLITIQNLEVLGRFLEQPAMRDSSGRVRPVLLTEQGFHTDSYGDQAQRQQAGSLVYAMNKVRQLPLVESFHYHRWIDHPDEGGLKLGLRTLPDDQHPFGQRKLAWYVYQAIGTDSEKELSNGLPKP